MGENVPAELEALSKRMEAAEEKLENMDEKMEKFMQSEEFMKAMMEMEKSK